MQTVGGAQTGLIDPVDNPDDASSAVTPAVQPAPAILPLPAILPAPAVLPVHAPVSAPSTSSGVNWKGVFAQSLSFLTMEEGFRVLTQPTAIHTHKPFIAGYVDSVENLHGWADGDRFLVNYVGHPVQGAVSGYIWIQNDRRYSNAQFGRNRDYWRSRLRAAAFAAAYSIEEEIGPVSEASIGATQSFFPQQGFVDHVITPVVGLGWIITEDAVDTYVIKRLEAHTSNPYLKMMFRGVLNPSRSLANALAGKVPWSRPDRTGLFSPTPPYAGLNSWAPLSPVDAARPHAEPIVPPFDLSIIALAQKISGSSGPCVGGGADASLRWAKTWSITLEVAGCKMTGLSTDLSGDTLDYMVGPRWTPVPTGQWSPYIQLLAGGQKISMEEFNPAAKAALAAVYKQFGKTLGASQHDLYTTDWGSNAFAVKLGAGVDLRVRSPLAIRVVGVDYTYSALHRAEFQVSSGLQLRIGNW